MGLLGDILELTDSEDPMELTDSEEVIELTDAEDLDQAPSTRKRSGLGVEAINANSLKTKGIRLPVSLNIPMILAAYISFPNCYSKVRSHECATEAAIKELVGIVKGLAEETVALREAVGKVVEKNNQTNKMIKVSSGSGWT